MKARIIFAACLALALSGLGCPSTPEEKDTEVAPSPDGASNTTATPGGDGAAIVDTAATPASDASTDAGADAGVAASSSAETLTKLLADAENAYNAGEHQKAYECYVKARDDHDLDKDYKVLHRIGACLHALLRDDVTDYGSERYRKAVEAYSKAIELKDELNTRYNRGVLLCRDPARREEGIADLTKVLEADENDAEARLHLAIAQHRRANDAALKNEPGAEATVQSARGEALAQYDRVLSAPQLPAALKNDALFNRGELQRQRFPDRQADAARDLKTWWDAVGELSEDAPQWRRNNQARTRRFLEEQGLLAPATPAANPATPAPNPATPAANPATPAPNPATPAPNPATPAANPATPAPNPATPAPNPATPAPKAPDSGAAPKNLAPPTAIAVSHKYEGVKQCRKCHRDKEKGDQFGKWQASRHAKAWETLASAKAKELAKAKGVADPQKALECVRCHATGAEHFTLEQGKWRAPEAMFNTKFVVEDGVQCESCHGAGSDYSGEDVMADRAQAVAGGMVIPDQALCERCHNAQSPTFRHFDYEKASAAIAHARPQVP